MHELGRARVLVTGGAGFIGSHLVECLLSLGSQVRCLVRRTSPLHYLPVNAVELTYGDLAGGEGLHAAVEGADIVFHIAGVTKARSSVDYELGNTRATENLLRAVEEAAGAARFVHVSSLAAAGPSPDGVPLTEVSDPHPVSCYGRSKLQAEKAVRLSRLAAAAVIVRPPVVFGPRDRDVLGVFRAAARGWVLQIGRAESCFSLVYVKDLVEGILAAARTPCAGGRTYFIANPHPVSWREFGTTTAALMKRKPKVLAVPRAVACGIACLAELSSCVSHRPGILSREKIREACQPHWTCDASHAFHELGFRAQTSLVDGLAETIAWYRQAGWLR